MKISASQMSLQLRTMQAKSKEIDAFQKKLHDTCLGNDLRDTDPDKVLQAVSVLEALKREVRHYRFAIETIADVELFSGERNNTSAYGTMQELKNQRNQMLRKLARLDDYLTYVIHRAGDGSRSDNQKLVIALTRQLDNHYDPGTHEFSAYNIVDVVGTLVWLLAFFKTRFSSKSTEN